MSVVSKVKLKTAADAGFEAITASAARLIANFFIFAPCLPVVKMTDHSRGRYGPARSKVAMPLTLISTVSLWHKVAARVVRAPTRPKSWGLRARAYRHDRCCTLMFARSKQPREDGIWHCLSALPGCKADRWLNTIFHTWQRYVIERQIWDQSKFILNGCNVGKSCRAPAPPPLAASDNKFAEIWLPNGGQVSTDYQGASIDRKAWGKRLGDIAVSPATDFLGAEPKTMDVQRV